MVKGSTSETKDYRAAAVQTEEGNGEALSFCCSKPELQGRGAWEATAADSWSCSENPPLPNAPAAELLKGNVWRLDPETQIFEVQRSYPPFYRERPKFTVGWCSGGRGRHWGGLQVSGELGNSFQSTCVSGGGVRSMWVIRQWLNLS